MEEDKFFSNIMKCDVFGVASGVGSVLLSFGPSGNHARAKRVAVAIDRSTDVQTISKVHVCVSMQGERRVTLKVRQSERVPLTYRRTWIAAFDVSQDVDSSLPMFRMVAVQEGG